MSQKSMEAPGGAGFVMVLGTGGTIAGAAADISDNVGYVAGQIAVEDLVARIPGFGHLPFSVRMEQVAQIDSKDMDWNVLRDIAQRCEHWLAQPGLLGIVITHGTDTLEETAWFLDCVLSASKPVVLTCAMRPSTSARADGPQNIGDAIAVAATTGLTGVFASCAGRVHHARFVQKVHTYRLDAFSSHDAGPAGFVEEGIFRAADGRKANLVSETIANNRARPRFAVEKIEDSSMPKVAIVMSGAGADESIVDALVAVGIKGIVVAGTGNGTIHKKLEGALLKARNAGIAIVLTTRCASAALVLNPQKVRDSSFAFIQSIGPVKARISLALDLMPA